MGQKKAIVSIVHREEIPGTPSDYDRKSVEVIKGMIKEAIGYFGGIREFVSSGDRVVIKPNAFWPLGPESALNTDPRVVKALIEIIREEIPHIKQLAILEGPAASWQVHGVTTLDCFERSGIAKVAQETDAELVAVDEDESAEVDVPGAWVLSSFELVKTLKDADCYISVPKLKTHNQALMTGGIKNQQGCLKSKDKYRFHSEDLASKLVDVYRVLKPKLAIIDAIWVLQGQGPLSLFPDDLVKNMNVLMAGKDCVALDAVSTQVMCFHPMEVDTTRIATMEGLGIGNLDEIEVKGTPIQKIKRPFRRPSSEVIGIYPNVHVYKHGGCRGCAHSMRIGLDMMKAEGFLSQIKEPINLVLGFNTELPENLNPDRTWVVGDCAQKNKERGRAFYPGCPHVMAATSVSTSIKAYLANRPFPDFSHLPEYLRPVQYR